MVISGRLIVHAPVVEKFLAKVPTARLFNVYGTWECLNVTYAELTEPVTWSKFAPVGKPQRNVTVYLLDEQGQVVPRMEIGEVCLCARVPLACSWYTVCFHIIRNLETMHD